MPVFQKEILAMTHHLKNAIIIQDKVYELQKLESADVCEGCALFSKCGSEHTSICQTVHNVNGIGDDENYNYKLLKLKPTMK